MIINDELRAAHARTQAVIEAGYERARRRMLDVFNDARREAGLMPFVILTSDRHYCVVPDRMRCPECGGRLHAEFDCWEATTGKPEEVSYLTCEHEDWRVDDGHGYSAWEEWAAITDAVLRWARSNVRIL